jgi:hypothetical protein
MAKQPTKPRTVKAAPAATAAAPSRAVYQDHDDHGHGAPQYAAADGMDYAAHEAMFERFGAMVKWGMGAGAVLVIFLFIVIHPFAGAPPT